MKTQHPTKDRIVLTAITLFNKKGAHSVTTNHIADSMKISPGNLYYHFRNKQEIIRVIFDRITGEFSALWSNLSIKSIDDLENTFVPIADIYYRYRFFYLELPTLVGQDLALKKKYESNHRQKTVLFENIYRTLIQNGQVVNPYGDGMLTIHLDNSWIVSDFWLSYLSISGKEITFETVREVTDHLRALFLPFLKNPQK
jgi:AcrR family transcriptional regulator